MKITSNKLVVHSPQSKNSTFTFYQKPRSPSATKYILSSQQLSQHRRSKPFILPNSDSLSGMEVTFMDPQFQNLKNQLKMFNPNLDDLNIVHLQLPKDQAQAHQKENQRYEEVLDRHQSLCQNDPIIDNGGCNLFSECCINTEEAEEETILDVNDSNEFGPNSYFSFSQLDSSKTPLKNQSNELKLSVELLQLQNQSKTRIKKYKTAFKQLKHSLAQFENPETILQVISQQLSQIQTPKAMLEQNQKELNQTRIKEEKTNAYSQMKKQTIDPMFKSFIKHPECGKGCECIIF